jgi:hypothetical protein
MTTLPPSPGSKNNEPRSCRGSSRLERETHNSLVSQVFCILAGSSTAHKATPRALKATALTDNIFDKQAPYPFPAVPPNSEFAGLNTGLPTYYEGLLGRYFILSANYKFNPF